MNFISKIKQSYSALDRIQQFACHLDDSGRVIWANKKLCEYLKQFEISLEGLPFVEVFSKVSKLSDEDIKTFHEELRCCQGEHLIRNKNGFFRLAKTRWYARPFSGNPEDSTSLWLGWDDEDHHTLEKILQRRSRISDLTQESILITDNKAVIEYVNPSFCRSSGYGLGEVIGITPASLINLPEDVSEMQKAFEGFQQGKNWEGIIYLRKKNGDALALNVRICPIFTSDKKEVEQYIAFATDISHERSLEKQIRELQRIESLGTLAAGVAHRFNNILASVIGHTELLAGSPGRYRGW